MGELVLYNITDGGETYTACCIVHGKVSKPGTSVVEVHSMQMPSLKFPVNDSVFKCVIMLSPGENRLTFITDQNERKTITYHYVPLIQNEPIHLCLLVARDSPLVFDSPRSQQEKEGGHDLELACRKLRLGGRLMQAFTNEQMLRNGFGQRTFQFVEERALDSTFKEPEMRNRVKIHILRSEKSVQELRDPNLAQQNPKATDAGGLYGIAMDALRKYGGPFDSTVEHPVQAAVMFLDTHWDPKLNLITAHAALGGGDDRIKLAIFGSHGLYSWPAFIDDVIPYFMDETRCSQSEVANDANECGTHWECFTLTLGAFMHEIGHLLGSPHQESGVMLRDYVRLNRSFLTKEAFSTRTNSYGAKPPVYPREECTWHRLDLLKFLYHPSFTVPQDYYDCSMMKPSRIGGYTVASPSVYVLPNNCCALKSETGIYCIQIICGDLARAHIEYLPLSLGGNGPQKEVMLSLDDLRSRIPPEQVEQYRNSFKVKVAAVNSPEAEWEKFPEFLQASHVAMAQYGFPNNVIGMRSIMYGGADRGQDVGIIPFDGQNVSGVRVYHGGALDGVRIFLSKKKRESTEPPIPPRSYMDKFTSALKSVSIEDTNGPSVLFGNQTNSYSDVSLDSDEHLVGFNIRSGCWVDGISIITSKGRVSNYFGNSNGGSQHQAVAPSGQHILGIYGRVGQWVDAIGIIYGSS
ncbi:LANO_0H07140g1_1 [Lachancea nothofagi CBS 11611]|uniref:LANO_0H07140g1_1 n=1 Tax=Lachancea nothofagi CBS 11611 TaxID=1266666 RepID=A0A1G4KLH0_9SACH|nr:LANO_0H07140g1_1 [Lachancea nothofagi CBS 11611]